jgi:hypothetical protein
MIFDEMYNNTDKKIDETKLLNARFLGRLQNIFTYLFNATLRTKQVYSAGKCPCKCIIITVQYKFLFQIL